MRDKTRSFYRAIYLVRRVEEEIARVYPSDKIKSPVHLSIGQESVSVGICSALRQADIVFGTYRGHAMYLAKGGSLKKMIAELYGKSSGCAKGKGGSMHLIDVPKNVMGTSAIVGTTLPVSVGFAYRLKAKRSKNIVVSFFGDGATDEGVFHESLNFAALKKLPVLFVCENNLYAIHSHYLRRHPLDNICLRAKAYGIRTERIKDTDVFKINETASRLIGEIRKGKGPVFLECMTYRWKEHVGPCEDFCLGYRDEKEFEAWKRSDALHKLKKLFSKKARLDIESAVEKEIEEAFNFAENSVEPKSSELYTEVFE
ncbi:MAG TPA: thiamine pyrophosphate-dependent dehydrogenase E1 component subunit alpha [Candidatus Omnitrophota bacterium]|nr:thiamine pyrophosphate-dependent dehydrogenase E1 component subunit alpha [Candidatus Omnitrophota bacterium]